MVFKDAVLATTEQHVLRGQRLYCRGFVATLQTRCTPATAPEPEIELIRGHPRTRNANVTLDLLNSPVTPVEKVSAQLHSCLCLCQDLDHFCPWTGTTIAGKNICCFYLFITMIVITLIFTMLVIVFSLAGHPSQYRNRYRR